VAVVAGVKDRQPIRFDQERRLGDAVEVIIDIQDLETINRDGSTLLPEASVLRQAGSFPSPNITYILNSGSPIQNQGIEVVVMAMGYEHDHVLVDDFSGVDRSEFQ